MAVESVPFHIALEGEATLEQYRGAFKAKTRLSHRDELERDKLRRRLLGEDAQHASPRAQNQAFILAELYVRLTESPKWWQGSDGGLDLQDDNIIAKVYEEALKVEQDALKQLREAAGKAEEKLKALSEE